MSTLAFSHELCQASRLCSIIHIKDIFLVKIYRVNRSIVASDWFIKRNSYSAMCSLFSLCIYSVYG